MPIHRTLFSCLKKGTSYPATSVEIGRIWIMLNAFALNYFCVKDAKIKRMESAVYVNLHTL